LVLFSACGEDCPDGYSGEDCLIRESDRFVATWEGFVDCGPGNEYTTLDILRETGPFRVTMQFPDPPDFSVQAHVGGDTLHIPEQIVAVPGDPDTTYYIIFNSLGILRGDTLDFDLILLFPGLPEQEKVYCRYALLK
jgi:hypothetical protein